MTMASTHNGLSGDSDGRQDAAQNHGGDAGRDAADSEMIGGGDA